MKGKKRVTAPILKLTDDQKPETFYFCLKACFFRESWYVATKMVSNQ